MVGFALTVKVTAAKLKQPVAVTVTFAYTVVLPLTNAPGVPIDVVNPELLNHVTPTPAAPPVTVLFTPGRLNEAVPENWTIIEDEFVFVYVVNC